GMTNIRLSEPEASATAPPPPSLTLPARRLRRIGDLCCTALELCCVADRLGCTADGLGCTPGRLCCVRRGLDPHTQRNANSDRPGPLRHLPPRPVRLLDERVG